MNGLQIATDMRAPASWSPIEIDGWLQRLNSFRLPTRTESASYQSLSSSLKTYLLSLIVQYPTTPETTHFCIRWFVRYWQQHNFISLDSHGWIFILLHTRAGLGDWVSRHQSVSSVVAVTVMGILVRILKILQMKMSPTARFPRNGPSRLAACT